MWARSQPARERLACRLRRGLRWAAFLGRWCRFREMAAAPPQQPQQQFDSKKWPVVYPAYIDAMKTLALVRGVPPAPPFAATVRRRPPPAARCDRMRLC